MQYEIILKDKDGEGFWFSDSYLPGIIREKALPLLMSDFAENFGFCDMCGMDTHCHPIDKHGAKYCTILFNDAIKPQWKLTDVM